ncbi:MAG: hypothetical protein JO026_03735 [Patescibacteria group bacterium]|nr:hypothetical protein [Patescibacteria group bacterium]
MKLNRFQALSLIFLLLLFLLWVWLFATHTTSGFYNYLFSFLFGLIPLIGGAIAMASSKMWGTFTSAVGRAVFFIGLGIFLWGCGETIWSYYNFFLNVPAPYPSLADIGFAPSIFFYGLGAVYLSRATGAQFGLRNKTAKTFVFLAPFVIFAFAYYLLVVVARQNVLVPEGESALKAFLDIVYPLGDFVGLSISVIVSGLSFKYLGGRYKSDVYAILGGLFVMFVADTIFSYTTTVGTYYNADFGDLILTLGTFLLSFGILGFASVKTHE